MPGWLGDLFGTVKMRFLAGVGERLRAGSGSYCNLADMAIRVWQQDDLAFGGAPCHC